MTRNIHNFPYIIFYVCILKTIAGRHCEIVAVSAYEYGYERAFAYIEKDFVYDLKIILIGEKGEEREREGDERGDQFDLRAYSN